MGTVRPGIRHSDETGRAWRPTFALASLGILSTAAAAALGLGGLSGGPGLVAAPPSLTTSTVSAGSPSQSLSVASGAVDHGEAAPILRQQPVRPETTSPGDSTLALPAIVSGAPRGRLLAEDLAAPHEQRVAMISTLGPVLSLASPVTGMDGTQLATAIVDATSGSDARILRASAVGEPLIALAAPVDESIVAAPTPVWSSSTVESAPGRVSGGQATSSSPLPAAAGALGPLNRPLSVLPPRPGTSPTVSPAPGDSGTPSATPTPGAGTSPDVTPVASPRPTPAASPAPGPSPTGVPESSPPPSAESLAPQGLSSTTP